MELLMALDFISLQDSLKLIEEVCEGIDIVEAGTPFIIKEGISAVSRIKSAFPQLKVMADLKMMDAGEYESSIAFDAGADIVTVLGVADDATISASVATAEKYGKCIMADMIGTSDLARRAAEVDALGVHYICLHTAFDIQQTGQNPLQEIKIAKNVVKRAKIAAAGGIKLSTIAEIAAEQLEIVIVGGGLTSVSDKRRTALEMKRIMNGGNK